MWAGNPRRCFYIFFFLASHWVSAQWVRFGLVQVFFFSLSLPPYPSLPTYPLPYPRAGFPPPPPFPFFFLCVFLDFNARRFWSSSGWECMLPTMSLVCMYPCPACFLGRVFVLVCFARSGCRSGRGAPIYLSLYQAAFKFEPRRRLLFCRRLDAGPYIYDNYLYNYCNYLHAALYGTVRLSGRSVCGLSGRKGTMLHSSSRRRH